MKITAISGDMAVKLALAGAALLALWYVVNKAAGTAEQAAAAVGDAVWAVSPTNQDNVIYQTANTITGGTPDRPLGVRIYDFFHPGAL